MRVTGRGDPIAREPFRSSWQPESVRALLAGSGLRSTTDLALLTVAAELELSVPTRQVRASYVAVGTAA